MNVQLREVEESGDVKVKGTFHSRIGRERPEVEERYSYILYLTSALDVGGCSTPRPSCFTPGERTQYALYRRLVGRAARSRQARKISSPPGFDPRTVQPVAIRGNSGNLFKITLSQLTRQTAKRDGGSQLGCSICRLTWSTEPAQHDTGVLVTEREVRSL